MRVLFNPATAAALITPTSVAGLTAGFGVFNAVSGFQQSRAAAKEARANIRVERIATERQIRDDRRETGIILARIRASLAARGGSAGGAGLVTRAAAERGRREERIRTDSAFREETLGARAGNLRRQGAINLGAGLVGTGAQSLSLFSVLERGRTGSA